LKDLIQRLDASHADGYPPNRPGDDNIMTVTCPSPENSGTCWKTAVQPSSMHGGFGLRKGRGIRGQAVNGWAQAGTSLRKRPTMEIKPRGSLRHPGPLRRNAG